MDSYNNSLWSSDSYYNRHSHLMQAHETLFQPPQYQSHRHIYHDYHHKSRQISIMNSSDSSSSNHSVSNDYKQFSIHYSPQSSLDYPNEQTINIDIFNDNPFFKPQLSAQNSDSSSGVEIIIDDESTEEHSSNYRHQSPTSSESRSRRVIIRSNDQVVTNSNRQRRRPPRRRSQRKQFMNEKKLMYKKRSSVLFSKHKRPRRSTDRWEHKEEKLKRLFDEYSNVIIDKEWNPLTRRDCQELYQYAFDKYQGKSRQN